MVVDADCFLAKSGCAARRQDRIARIFYGVVVAESVASKGIPTSAVLVVLVELVAGGTGVGF